MRYRSVLWSVDQKCLLEYRLQQLLIKLVLAMIKGCCTTELSERKWWIPQAKLHLWLTFLIKHTISCYYELMVHEGWNEGLGTGCPLQFQGPHALQIQLPLLGEQQRAGSGAIVSGCSRSRAMLFPSVMTCHYLLESRGPGFKLTESK